MTIPGELMRISSSISNHRFKDKLVLVLGEEETTDGAIYAKVMIDYEIRFIPLHWLESLQ